MVGPSLALNSALSLKRMMFQLVRLSAAFCMIAMLIVSQMLSLAHVARHHARPLLDQSMPIRSSDTDVGTEDKKDACHCCHHEDNCPESPVENHSSGHNEDSCSICHLFVQATERATYVDSVVLVDVVGKLLPTISVHRQSHLGCRISKPRAPPALSA